MKKGLVLYLTIFLLIFLPLTSAIIYHPANEIKVSIDGVKRSIDDSITYITGAHTYANPSLVLNEHDATQIWVKTNSEKTLLEALQSTSKLCKPNSATSSYSSFPTGPDKAYHYATEVQFNSGKTLQEAIDDGTLATTCPARTCIRLGNVIRCTSTDCVDYGTVKCDGTCTGSLKPQGTPCNNGGTCSSTGFCSTGGCSSAAGQSCTPLILYGDPECVSGIRGCDGLCIVGGYTERGTFCNDEAHSCDGSGICEGYTGTGCASCEFGVQNIINFGGHTLSACTVPSGYQGIDSSNPSVWYSGDGSRPYVYCYEKQTLLFGLIVIQNENYDWQIKPE